MWRRAGAARDDRTRVRCRRAVAGAWVPVSVRDPSRTPSRCRRRVLPENSASMFGYQTLEFSVADQQTNVPSSLTVRGWHSYNQSTASPRASMGAAREADA
jgi:hypothetical protein